VRFESRLRPTQGIPAAAMVNLVLLLVFHLVALTWQAASEPEEPSQSIAIQTNTVLRLHVDARGAIRIGDREVADAELVSIFERQARAGSRVRVEVDGPAGLADARLAEILGQLRAAGAEEIRFSSSEPDR